MDDRTTKALPALFLGVLVITTGCLTGPFTGPSTQQGPVGLNLTNDDNDTNTFEVFVVDRPANLTIEDADRGNYSADIGEAGISNHKLNSYNNTVTGIEPPDTARTHGRYVMDPGETNLSNITNFKDDSAVVVVIYHNSTVASYVTSQCDGDLVAVRVMMHYYGASGAYDCDGGAGE